METVSTLFVSTNYVSGLASGTAQSASTDYIAKIIDKVPGELWGIIILALVVILTLTKPEVITEPLKTVFALVIGKFKAILDLFGKKQ